MALSTDSEFRRSLQKIIQEQADEVPPGWKTTRQIAEEEGLSRIRVGIVLRQLVDSGDWEMAEFKIRLNPGLVRATPHYRKKPCTPKRKPAAAPSPNRSTRATRPKKNRPASRGSR